MVRGCLGVVVLVLVILAMAGLWSMSHKPQTVPPTTAATTPTVKPVTVLSDLNEDEMRGCATYGDFASNLVADRDRGVPLSRQLAAIQTRSPTQAMVDELTTLAKLIYTN